jgi:hypothetical protein
MSHLPVVSGSKSVAPNLLSGEPIPLKEGTMEVVLMLAGLGFAGLVASALLLSALLRHDSTAPGGPGARIQADPPQFFKENAPWRDPDVPPSEPVQVLLLRIEQHVRVEQAAAESFHLCPTSASLHTHTTSPLVH